MFKKEVKRVLIYFQIQLAGGGNPQIIHSTPSPSAYSYVPVRQVYQQAKPIKEAQKKVLFTSINSSANNKSNQVNLILPNNQNTNSGTKSPITSLILPQMTNKATITGMLVPNNSPAGTNINKPAMASLLLPTNPKYPNIAPLKKVPIPNIILPQQNVNNKPTNVPNIIRQTNTTSGKNVVGILSSSTAPSNNQVTSLLLTPNANTNNKQTPTSVGLILPTSGGSHDIIMPPSTSSQTHSILVPQSTNTVTQSHGIFIPQPNGGIIMPVSQSTGGQPHSIIMPQSTGGQSQLTNLIITSTSASIPNSTTTPVGSLLISNNNR